MKPATFVVTRIEDTAGYVKDFTSAYAAQFDPWSFTWGPPRSVVEVWQGAGAKQVTNQPNTRREVIKRISAVKAMDLYDRLVNRGEAIQYP